MALKKHETKAVAGSVVGFAATEADIYAAGCAYGLVSSTADIRMTWDGQTDPAVGSGSEVGLLLGPTGDVRAIILTAEEIDNARMLDVSTDARVQCEFMQENRLRGGS